LYNARKRRQRTYQWRDEVRKYIYSKTTSVDGWRVGATDEPSVRGARFDDSKWPAAKPGQLLGGINQFVWLRNKVAIPRDFAGGEVWLHIDVEAPGALFGQRGLVFVDGKEAVGLDRHHKDVPLAKRARGGERFTVAAEIYTGPVESFTLLAFGRQHDYISKTIFGKAQLRLVNADAYKAYYDFATAVDILEAMKDGSRLEAQVLSAIDAAIAGLDLSADEAERNASFRAASAVLAEGLFTGEKGDAAGTVAVMGQSHIDMAWLWPRAETVRKCASTMANTLTLEKLYPSYRFSHSQAQGFQWIKDSYPALHEATKRAARAGRVEAVGGMWVEADLNCAGGEALARQFLYGQRFFEREFGGKCRVGWLIDTFGYSWGMPQILKESGLDYFVSTKPTWNDTNTFPFTFFWWEGPDGSRVLTHIPPLTYGSDVTLKAIIDTQEKNREARLAAAPGFLFGKSDGGGGPRVEDLENLKRLAVSRYAPKLEIKNVTEYFDDLPKTLDYPVLVDEMYVETHRGTYTTQAQTKRNNRKAECALYTAEVAASAATMLGAKYPQKALEAAWKKALFNQFHDILPGSSISLVYEDADRDFAEVFRTTEKVTADALSFIAKNVDATGPGKAALVFNPSAWERTGVVEVEAGGGTRHVADAEGTPLPCQNVAGARGRMAVLVSVPPCGWKTIRIVEGKAPRTEAVSKVRGRALETALLSVRLNASGQLASVRDRRAGRQVLAADEAGNRLELSEDIPVEYEAWDIDEWVREKTRVVRDLVSFAVAENGPVRTVVKLVWKQGRSTFAQKMILYGHTKRIDFVTDVDWREKKTLFKAAFPLAVRARRATYEIAFGAIDRSTHESNPFDWARFEVPAHKWADLSQADYGASVLNDSKYGYSASGNVMRISLLRSPESPGEKTDQGRQEFTYSLLPHEGDWRAGDTVKEAFDLNVPLVTTAISSSGGGLPAEGWFLEVKADDGAPVVLTALKMAEDGRGFVARIYDPHGRNTGATIRSSFGMRAAERANFLEEPQGKLRLARGGVRVNLAAWKIATVRFTVR